MHARRAEKIRRLIAARAADGARDRAGAVGQRRGHAGLPDAVGGARPRRPAAAATGASSKPRPTASCASRRSRSLRPDLSVAGARPAARSRSRWATFARSSASALGSPANHASRISRSSACEVAAQAEREHVGVVPAPRARGRGRVEAQRRADAADLVGGDRRARARPAADDRLLGAPLGDVAGGGLAGPRPVAALAARRARRGRASRGRDARARRRAARRRPSARRRRPRSACARVSPIVLTAGFVQACREGVEVAPMSDHHTIHPVPGRRAAFARGCTGS